MYPSMETLGLFAAAFLLIWFGMVTIYRLAKQVEVTEINQELADQDIEEIFKALDALEARMTAIELQMNGVPSSIRRTGQKGASHDVVK